MERTPNRKFKFSSSKPGDFRQENEVNSFDSYRQSTNNNDNSSTPMQSKPSISYDECSPIFVPSTQEAYDELDVAWDWNSPQSKPKQKKPIKQKRLQVNSPKTVSTIKKQTGNQSVVNEKVKNQLEKLKNQLESELKRSACDKVKCSDELKTDKLKTDELKRDVTDRNVDLADLVDLFDDDSIEEELIKQSQQVESLFNLELKKENCDIGTITVNGVTEFRKTKSNECLDQSASRPTTKLKSTVSSGDLYVSPSRQRSTTSVKLEAKFQMTFDDSLDFAMQSFKDGDFKTKANSSDGSNRCKSDSSLSMSFVEDITSFDKQEIERKRQEALAKIKAKKINTVISPPKRTLDNNVTKIESTITKIPKAEESPIKCSPEEIEQKRLQALAKLEAKKKQDIIERNRREALKRLEMNKKKRAMLLQNIRS